MQKRRPPRVSPVAASGFCPPCGRFTEPTLAEFGAHMAKHFLSYLGSLAFHAGIAATVHAALAVTRGDAIAHGAKAS